jgi:DNA repair exonuclease SbcCD ATPase subunit
MILNSIKLAHFKCFESYEYKFNKLTLIQGINGKGKSTLCEAIVFALYGFYKELLSDLPTKGVAKTASVTLCIADTGHNYTITRHYPLKVEITVDGVKKALSTAEANTFINDTFGDRLFFSRFRFLDIMTKETDFLSEGQVALKKIIFAGMDETFNTIRQNLGVLKSERELWNRDKLVGFNCYPSKKRQDLLTNAYHTLSESFSLADKDYQLCNQSLTGYKMSLSSSKTKLQDITQQLKKLQTIEKCYTCGQVLVKEKYEELMKTRLEIRNQLEQDIIGFQQDIDIESDMLGHLNKERELLRTRKDRVRNLITRLENRLKTTKYIYGEKDVLVMKKATAELDSLSSLYLCETVRSLEPIINSVLAKINYTLTFDVDTKGKFNIILNKDGQQYKYKELSTGQKLVVQTAFKIAMLMQVGKSGIIICDEGFSTLDDGNLEHIVELFKSLPLQLIFIAQRSNLNDDAVDILQL